MIRWTNGTESTIAWPQLDLSGTGRCSKECLGLLQNQLQTKLRFEHIWKTIFHGYCTLYFETYSDNAGADAGVYVGVYMPYDHFLTPLNDRWSGS